MYSGNGSTQTNTLARHIVKNFQNKEILQKKQELRCVMGVRKFRHIARELLLISPQEIEGVVLQARRLNLLPGGTKLLWQMDVLRDHLPHIPERERERYIKRALRSAHGTFSMPLDD